MKKSKIKLLIILSIFVFISCRNEIEIPIEKKLYVPVIMNSRQKHYGFNCDSINQIIDSTGKPYDIVLTPY